MAAFECGRHFNRLRFHLQQAPFFDNCHHARDAWAAALAAHSAGLVLIDPEGRGQYTQEALDEIRRLLEDTIPSEEYQDLIWSAGVEIESSTLRPTPADVRKDLLAPILNMAGSFKAWLWRGLDDQKKKAFVFGELVDQGLCRADIVECLDAPQPPAPSVPRPLPQSGARASRGLLNTTNYAQVVASASRNPGDLPPVDTWYGIVPPSWNELGIISPLPANILRACQSQIPPTQADIEELIEKARAGLAQLSGFDPASHVGAASNVIHPGKDPATTGASLRVTTSARRAPSDFARLERIKKAVDKKNSYLGESLPVLKVFRKIQTLNSDPTKPVLITGETGTGKSEIVGLIHTSSKRSGVLRRYQASTFAGSDSRIALGEWTGYGRQSGVTDIGKNGREGILEVCSNGTVFLDEAADVVEKVQGLLLDVLDGKPVILSPVENRLVASTSGTDEYVC